MVKSLALDKFVLNDFVEDERGLIGMQVFSIDSKALKEDSDATSTYFTEEFIAMILKYGQNLAEA